MVPKSIKMTLKVALNFLLPKGGSSKQGMQDWPLPFIYVNLFLIHNVLLGVLLADIKPKLFLQSFQLLL